ncbi:ABC transporter substrate-binding protein [Melghirimyces algeriensis]|uniref:Iron complex transport system substrate-binding protein n=1 Tax=Melghirimyces algeriensis TaxID=910412 RepID=A0A521ABR7_9BACL|nr:iron-siderophore ABC transporter substrate-binding protein [Melghirimyces algeriensis]SMO32236.1 iron complex transport system substrate-binding protein [Melghirimyces algeriensis]
MHTYKPLRMFALIPLLFTVLLTACSGGNEASVAEETKKETREIKHAMGTTTIEGTPKRVVTLYQGATDTAVAFGIQPVGVVESWLEKPMYKYLREDLKEAEIVGLETQPNLEEIAKLNPDLIVASKLRHEEVYEKLSQIAPTVATDTVYEFKDTVQLMGKAMNQEEKAEKILADWDKRVSDFKTKIQKKLGDEWPMEVSILNFRADHARIYFDSFAGSILKEVGFTRPENQQSNDWGIKLTDKESITEMNADVFYIFMSDEKAVEKTYNEWTSHPLWKNLDAVKNDQVSRVDEVIWNMGGGIKAANLLLDDLYDRFELEQE